MNNDGIILGLTNKFLSYIQKKCLFFTQNNNLLKNIDIILFLSIISTFILSLFSESDIIGYAALISVFLTIIKLFLKTDEKLEMNLFEKFLLVYFLFVIISLAGSSLFHLSLKGFFKTFTYLSFYLSVTQYYRKNINKIPLTIIIIAACAVSQGIVGFIQNFAQVAEISTWQDVSSINPEDVMTRVYGTLHPFNPNLFGGYLVATIPCLLGSFTWFLNNKKFKTAGIILVLSALTSISLVFSGCRGAYIGLALILTSFFGFYAKIIWDNGYEKLKKIYLWVLGAIITVSTAAILLISSIRTRIFSIFAMRGDSSTSFRFNVYQSAIQMAKDNWLLGIGVGNQNFREIYGLYMRTGFDALSSYCVFLEIMVESGIFALLAFLAFLITLTNQAVKYIKQNKNFKNSLIMLTALTSIIAIITHGFVDTIFFRPQVQFVFWTMCAFVSALLYEESLLQSDSK